MDRSGGSMARFLAALHFQRCSGRITGSHLHLCLLLVLEVVPLRLVVEHEVIELGVIVLHRVALQNDVLGAVGAIFLLLLDYFRVEVPRGIVVRELGLELNERGLRLRYRLLVLVRGAEKLGVDLPQLLAVRRGYSARQVAREVEVLQEEFVRLVLCEQALLHQLPKQSFLAAEVLGVLLLGRARRLLSRAKGRTHPRWLLLGLFLNDEGQLWLLVVFFRAVEDHG